MGAQDGRVAMITGGASGFGAASSLVVVLLWVYFSAQILLVDTPVPPDCKAKPLRQSIHH